MGFPQQLPTAHSWDPQQPPQDIPCHSPPLPHGLRGHSLQGCWAEGTCARSGAGGGEGLGAAQQGRTRCGTNVRGDPQRGWSRGDVTCVELRAVDRSHHWVQLPACGQGEPVRPGASSPRCSPPPRLCSKGPRLPSPVSCWAWGARGGLHPCTGQAAAALPSAQGCGGCLLQELSGSLAARVPRDAPAHRNSSSPRAGPYHWCRGWQPSCSS